jgi:hypothetical protein
MVQVLCLQNFFDVENNINRHVGDKWSVTKARANAILSAPTKGLIDIISMEAEPKIVPPVESTKPKVKRTRKAK